MAPKNMKTKKTKKKKSVQATSGLRIRIPNSITFDYIKSNFFRVIRVDGVHGGFGPKLNMIQMALFSERQSIPKREIYEIAEGKLTGVSKKEGRDAVIREVEIEAVFDIDTARAVRDWLDEKIKASEKLQTEVQSK